jgi:hypothetical protein
MDQNTLSNLSLPGQEIAAPGLEFRGFQGEADFPRMAA